MRNEHDKRSLHPRVLARWGSILGPRQAVTRG